ncbi:hypothetical protein K443DRAFT_12798 [Laccaria amethystina LaAM-08-1]|uniref:Uncharacterized protein n=1 Tax=Laccaria amethystina LaAM-08-1 TaxID=1095629 RepID=A0A0C9WXG9_9AGAR|nr:hypothetical protein K443DRAFT_12798 [Laccaria amethystina LaAM-08-1]
MDPFPDAMDWPTPASEAYSGAPRPYEYEGTPVFSRDDPSLFTLSSSRSEGGGSTRTTTSPYTPRTGTLRMNMNMNDSTQPILHQPKPTTPTATAFSDMWKDALGFDAGHDVEGAGGGGRYEYADGMGMVV